MPATEGTPEVVVFRKEGCHLCDAVEEEIRSENDIGASLTTVDIDGDAALHDAYWMRVPVVTVGGREVFEAKMMDLEGRWRERLPSLLKGA